MTLTTARQPIVGGLEHATASVGSRYETATSAGVIPSPTPDWIAQPVDQAVAESVSHVSVPAVDWFTIATRAAFRAELETVLYV